MESGTKKSSPFPRFLTDHATVVAKQLLGCYLVRDIGTETVRVMIVETESYDQTDAASHSFNGRTARTDVMFGPSGHLYVYFTYGMHYCCNVVTGEIGEGQGVLVRAAMPVEGERLMQLHRGKTGPEVSNGPAKLCEALSIDRSMNGHNLQYAPLRLELGVRIPDEAIVNTPRIGISKEKDALRRFYIRDNPYVSHTKVKARSPQYDHGTTKL
jgi:DNA-3-methyladenine glycosylase